MTSTSIGPATAPDGAVALRVDEALAAMVSERERADTLAGRALAQALAEGDAHGECLARLALAHIGLRDSDYRPAVPEAERALALAAGLADPLLRDMAQHVRAVLVRRQGDASAAMALLSELHARADQRPPLHAYFTVSVLAVLQRMGGAQVDALRGFYAALELASRCGSLGVEVHALNNLGSQQLDLYNLEDARQMLERCLQGALRLDSRRQVIFAAGNLLHCLSAMGQAVEALAVARQHLIPLTRPDDDAQLNRDCEIAQACLDNGQWEEARGYLARAPQTNAQTNEHTAHRTWLEARLMMADGQPSRALAHCLAQQARQAHAEDDTNMPLDVLWLAELAATAAAACGEHEQAYRQLSLAFATQDRLLGRAARARFASLQIQHEVQQAVRQRDDALLAARQLADLNATLQAQIEANERLNQRLSELALQDALTGLYNRRHLFQAGAALLAQAGRHGQQVAVVMIDLDHFKQINDRHGHEGGDLVLKAFADLLRSGTRASDLCCRYGGEEFVVLMPASDAEAALQRMHKLLERFVAHSVDVPGGASVNCSFSAGVQIVQVGGTQTLSELLKDADLALYEAKRLGRNRVVACRLDGAAPHRVPAVARQMRARGPSSAGCAAASVRLKLRYSLIQVAASIVRARPLTTEPVS